MFWDAWIPAKYLVKSQVAALEFCFGNAQVNLYYALLKNKNNKVELTEQSQLRDVTELPAHLQKNKIPLVLVLNGKGVVLKKINLASTTALSVEELIRENLPAINTADFYIQVYKQEQSGFIAFCRRDLLDKTLQQLKTLKHELATINLGAPAALGLQPVWANLNTLHTSSHRIEISNNQLDDIIAYEETTEPQKLLIDGISFSSNHSLAFAAGLAYLMQRKLWQSNNPQLENILLRHIEKNKFRVMLVLFVALAFVLAVGNVLFYTNYYDKNNQLESELNIYQGKYEKINQLLGEYQKNKNLIEGAGVLNKNKLSEYADKIGESLPDEVVLSDLYFNPLRQDEEHPDSLITFDTKHLIIKGNCSKSMIVNEWLSILKMKDFVKSASLEKFMYNSDGLLPNFEVKLVTE